MEKTITLLDLIKESEKYEDLTDKAEYIESVVNVANYVNYKTLLSNAEKIINTTSYVVDTSGNRELKISTPLRHIMTIHCAINMYTSIELNTEDYLGEMNLIKSANIKDILLDIISYSDIAEFEDIVEETMRDYLQNEYETHAFINNCINKLSLVIKELSEIIPPEVFSELAEQFAVIKDE